MTCFIAEKDVGRQRGRGAPHKGLTVPPKLKKMGYKGVESTELVFDGYRCPAENVLGGEDGRPQQGLRADDGRTRGRPRQRRRPRGRASRSARSSSRLKLLAGAQDVRQADRRAPGHPVQARRHGDAGRRRAAAHDARRAHEGRRHPARTSRPAWPSCSPPRPGRFCVEESFRIHGGYGYSKEYEIEAALPRRATAADRRGHLRDPADGHRQEAPAAPQAVGGGGLPGPL